MRYLSLVSVLCILLPIDTTQACGCFGCPPVSTTVKVHLRNGTHITGNVITRVTQSSVFDRTNFDPNLRLCESEVFSKQIDVWQTLPVPNYQGLETYDFRREWRKSGYTLISTGKSKVVLPRAVLHAGSPKQINVADVVRLERLSESIAPIFRISDRNRKYLTQSPKLIAYVEDSIEAKTECWSIAYSDVHQPESLAESCRWNNIDEEGVVVLFRSYGT